MRPAVTAKRTLPLGVGPLRYHLVASDEWSAAALEALAAHLECRPFDGAPDRRIVYAGLRTRSRGTTSGLAMPLPHPLAVLADGPVPDAGWLVFDHGATSVLWMHEVCRTAFVTPVTSGGRWRSPYHFPWDVVGRDIAARGGALLHAALAVRDGDALLFTAPPGGGKTTTVMHLPKRWRLLGDDGCLVWRAADRSFAASPLPTWSDSLGVDAPPDRIDAWHVGDVVRLSAAVLVVKALLDELLRPDPVQAVSALFRGFSEHPIALDARLGLRELLLRTVCDLIDVMPCVELRLTERSPNLGRLLDEILGG